MFRSEKMYLCQIYMDKDAAYSIVSLFGEHGLVHFKDANENIPVTAKRFVPQVRMCDDLEKKLRFIEAEAVKHGVRILPAPEDPRAPRGKEVNALMDIITKTEIDIKNYLEKLVVLKKKYLENLELSEVYEKTMPYFSKDYRHSLRPDLENDLRIDCITGVVPTAKKIPFEKMIFRISHGNAYFRTFEITEPLEDPVSREFVKKSVFIIFYQGIDHSQILKVCSGFRTKVYPTPKKIEKMMDEISAELEDTKYILNETEDHGHILMATVKRDLTTWKLKVAKMKAIYHALNLCKTDISKKLLVAEVWIPGSDIPKVKSDLLDGGAEAGSTVESFIEIVQTEEEAPTFIRNNKYTQGFQNLINAYGIPAYQEVNPALYSIITFPFLFSVMFGDLGHAIIMTSFGLFLVIKEKKLEKKMAGSDVGMIFYSGRYIVLLMGFFSIYSGLIYNDFFGMSLNAFGSSWIVNKTSNETFTSKFITLDPKEIDYIGSPYPFGVDPVWQVAKNKIMLKNSFEMKIAIIFGVIHMAFGICLGVFNHIHFKTRLYIFIELLPQLIFLLALFSYLAVLMIIKWIKFNPKSEDVAFGTSCAPALLLYFIAMVLNSAPTQIEGCPLYMYANQKQIQTILFLMAMLMVPMILMGKPLAIYLKRKRAAEHPQGKSEHDEEQFSDVVIHQSIHTIEFVLGTVSHTASYLRLWALSLAHSQLSEVLWMMVFRTSLAKDWGIVSSVMVYIMFAVWATLTCSILVLMEGLSAFLHTLRLHWVEFMSKFYSGTGYIFKPFSFVGLLNKLD